MWGSVIWGRHHGGMRVGVVDVGSNTVRLLVVRGGRVDLTRRAMLRLGADVERTGSISPAKLDDVARVVAEYVAAARERRVERLEVLVTSPARQAANGDELVERLAAAARVPVRVLSATEEGRLAFVGALAAARGPSRKTVAVCDVGGGSAQVVVGTRHDGAAWTRSIDIGSMRLTSRVLGGDPPGADALVRARAEVERYLEGFAPPLPQSALAVGGSSRAVRAVAGARLGGEELAAALDLLARTTVAELVDRHGIDPDRAPTVAAGTVILSALQARLGVPLRVVRGGIREGAIVELQRRDEAAA
jgi:exopolyphosphatase/guanosine-5'-triphosphate,3'-diphosphate pyrophosphatase